MYLYSKTSKTLKSVSLTDFKVSLLSVGSFLERVYELLRLHCKNLFFFFFFDPLNQVYLIFRSGRSKKPMTHFDRGNTRGICGFYY